MINWKNNNRTKPAYAVIFSLLRSNDLEGYEAMDEATLNEVKKIDGYLGYESVYNGNRGIFISYWASKDAINKWKENLLHTKAKQQGKSRWYTWYNSQICKIESYTEK